MKAIICGANGAMGTLLCNLLKDEVVGKVSIDGASGVPTSFQQLGSVGADIILDFSHHTAVSSLLEYAVEHRCAAVIGTTGHTAQERALIARASEKIPVFFSGTMSLGIAVLCRLAKQAAAFFPEADIEIVEVHHNRKVDAPSGTAHLLFDSIAQVRPEATEHCGRSGEGKRSQNEIGISSLRMGGIVGIHEVHVCTPTQALTLRHEAFSREMMAEGAVDAARFLLGKPVGLYDMNDLVEER